MPRHIACLTFDFDAMSGFISRGLSSPTPISRGEVFTTMEEAAREYQGRRTRT